MTSTSRQPSGTMSDGTTDRLLSIRQLATKLGWSEGRLYRLVAARRIPHVRVPGEKGRGTITFRESQIEAWLERLSIPARGELATPTPARAMVVGDRAAECERLGIPVHHRFT